MFTYVLEQELVKLKSHKCKHLSKIIAITISINNNHRFETHIWFDEFDLIIKKFCLQCV